MRGDGAVERYTHDQVSFVRRDRARDLRTPDGIYREYYLHDYTRNIYETQIMEADPARLLAGGNLELLSERVTNENSHVLAGGHLHGNMDGLDNISVELQRRVEEAGTSTRYWRVTRRHAGRSSR